MVAIAKKWPEVAAPATRSIPGLKTDLPAPALPAHGSVRVEDGAYVFSFLNQEKSFTLPLDWHRSDLNVGTRLWKLNLHYFDYACLLSDLDFQNLVQDWIAQNRPFRSGYWLDSWNSYSMSIRLVAWMGEYARRGDRFDAKFVSILLASIYEQLKFLHNNIEDDIGGNHIIKNIKALYWGGAFFTERAAERFVRTANSLLARELKHQILGDGFHFELSPAYHGQVFGDLLDCWRLMPSGNLRSRLAADLKRMAQVVSDTTHPDGLVSLFNDGGLNMTNSCSQLLERYTQLFEETPTPREIIVFSDAGYYGMRNDRFYLLCDAGRVGPDGLPAHAHGDILAFELTVGGRRIVVDAGVYEYNSGARRSRSRSTVAHNTLTLDDQDQCEFWSAFRLGRRANVQARADVGSDGALIIDAQHDGYSHLSGKPVHRRITRADPGGQVIVRDEVTGGVGQTAVARLLFAPSVQVERQGEGRLLLLSGPVKIELDAGPVSVTTQTVPWWPDFGCEIETTQVILNYGPVPGVWEFRLSLVDE